MYVRRFRCDQNLNPGQDTRDLAFLRFTGDMEREITPVRNDVEKREAGS